MKKVSLLVLVCMLVFTVLAFTACNECEHTYGSDWNMDKNGHFHTCSLCGAKDAAVNHTDANNDGACDDCAVILKHDHVFSPAWTSDATDHWHAPLCGHTVEPADKAAHTLDAIGNCTVCGSFVAAPDVSTIEKAIALAAKTQGSVKDGTLNLVYNYTDAEYGFAFTYNFEYGKDYLHILNVADNANTYISLNADGTVFHITLQPNNYMMPVEILTTATKDDLAGPAVALGDFITDASTVYGAITTLEYFYEAFEADEAATSNVENGVYSFAFATDAYACEVSFTLDPKTYILNDLDVIIDNYYAIEFEQFIEPVNKYTPELTIPTDYELLDANGNPLTMTGDAYDALDVTIGTTKLVLGNIAPDGALIDALGVSEIVITKDGEVVYDAYASYKNGLINIEFYKIGDYMASFTVGEDAYEIPFHVTYKAPEYIEINETDEYSSSFMPLTNKTIFVGSPLILVGIVPENCDRMAYTFSITGNPAGATITPYDGVIYDYNGDMAAYQFVATEAGVYEIVITSTADPSITATATITVEGPPTAAEIATGKWGLEEFTSVYATFNPTDDTRGTVTVEVQNFYGGPVTAVFTYTITDGAFVAVFESGDAAVSGVEINSAFGITVWYNGLDYPLEKMAATPGGNFVEPGTKMNRTGITIDAAGTYTYNTTIAAGGLGYFMLYNPGYVDETWAENWTITVVVEGDVTVASGEITDADFGVNVWTGVNFNLQNAGATDADVTFTITVTAA